MWRGVSQAGGESMEKHPTMRSEEKGTPPSRTKLVNPKAARRTRACAAGECRPAAPSSARAAGQSWNGTAAQRAEAGRSCPAPGPEQRGHLTPEGRSWAGL